MSKNEGRNLFTGLVAAFLLLQACNSQPAKYRRKKECDCPKWNRVAPAPGNSAHASAGPAGAPYYCGPAATS